MLITSFKLHVLRIAILSSLMGYSFVGLAQTANEKQYEDIEKITVTGSRISRTDMEVASPITVIDAEYISKSGFSSLEAVLNAQPIIAGANLGATTNNGSGGSATVNLRGLGEYRTLVLLNGRRYVNSGIGADSSVDLNTIPLSLIQSIEILKDGASAVYGSDAIAGVVNIITVDNFVGTQIDAYADVTDKNDGELYNINIIHGIETSNGNFVIGLDYSGREDIIQSDRDFVSPGCSYYVPGGTVDGLTPDGNGGFEYIEPCYDYTKDSYAQTPNDLFSVFSSYRGDLNHNMTLSVDFLYSHRYSKQQIAADPILLYLDTNYIEPEYLPYFDYPDYGIPDYLEYARRMEDSGPRTAIQKTDTYRLSVELTGEFLNDVSWNSSLTYGRNDAKESWQNSTHYYNVEDSIYNHQNLWFSGETIARQLLVDDGVIYTDRSKGGNEQAIFTFGIDGETDNSIGYAIGIESRYESGFFTPSETTQLGHATHAQQDKTDGSYNIQSAFAEISLPIGRDLLLDSALRLDHYSTFGSELTWKVGATYQVTDSLKLRGVASTGFRAPNVSELYGGNFGAYEYLYDPWADYEDAELLVTYTGGENLKAEESDSLTLGMVWDITSQLSTTIDYWNFTIENSIGSPDLQGNMLACFEQNIDACESINATPDGDLSNLISPLININEQDVSGVDINVSYLGDKISVDFNSTYMIEFVEDGIDYSGWLDGFYGGYAKWRANLDIQGQLTDNLSMLYSIQYIDSMDGEFYGEAFNTASVAYHDVSVTYDFSDDFSINSGVINLFDKEPEFVPGGDDMDTVPSIYDVIGRSFFVSASYHF